MQCNVKIILLASLVLGMAFCSQAMEPGPDLVTLQSNDGSEFKISLQAVGALQRSKI